MANIAKLLKKRTTLLVMLTMCCVAAVVAVAYAAPTIPSNATPPSGHYTGACSGCHTITPVVPPVEPPVVTPPSGDTSPAVEPSHGSDDGSETFEADDVDDANEIEEADDSATEIEEADDHSDGIEEADHHENVDSASVVRERIHAEAHRAGGSNSDAGGKEHDGQGSHPSVGSPSETHD